MTDNLPTAPEDGFGAGNAEEAAFHPLSMNPEDYREIWAETEFSEEQYTELLRVLWEIGQSIVRMGWNAELSQVLFAQAIKNTGADSGKSLVIEHTNVTKYCADKTAKKVSDDE